MEQDKLKQLYDLVGKEYELPEYEVFSKAMQDKNKAQQFHSLVANDYEMPDFDTFYSSVKKKADSLYSGKEQSELEADLLGKSVAPFSRIELPEPRTQSLSELQKAVEEKEKQLQEVVLWLDEEKKNRSFEIPKAGVHVVSGELWSLKQEAKRLENEISETKLEAIQLSKKQSKERVLKTKDELVQTTKESADEIVRLKEELKTTEAMLKDIGAAGLFKMPIKERISKSKEGQAKATEIENRIREIEEAQRKDLNNVKAKYQDVAEDLSVLISRQNKKYDIKSKLLEGYEKSPFEDIREDFEKRIGVDEGFLSDITPFNITEQDVLVSKLWEIQELQDEVSFRIDQIGENFTSTSDLNYSNWLLAILGSMESLGTYISLGGMGQDMWGMAAGKGLEVWAQGKSPEHIDYVMPFMEYSQSELGDFKWNQMYDPLWWKTNGGGLAGSMTFFGTVGLLSVLTANPLVGAMGLKGGAAMLAGGLISSGISSPVLAAVYGGTAYKNVLNQLTAEGVDTEEAIDRASIAAHNTFKTVLPVSLALNTGMMGLAYKTVFTGVRTSMLGKAVDIAKGSVYSGVDNLWQENTTRYFTEKALGIEPTGIFAFDPYAQHAFAAGTVMNFGHVMLSGVTGTMKGVVGMGNVKGYEAIAEPFVQANLALGKDRFAVEATAAAIVKQGRMTKQEATQFITETVELMDNAEFQQLKGVAAIEYAKNRKAVNEAKRVLEKNPENSAAKKIVSEKETRNSELAMNGRSDLNVVIEDGKLVAYDMNGAVVEYDAMNEKQRLHYDTVKEKEPFTPLLNEPVKGKYIITQNNNKQTFDNVEEFLVALEALDVSEDTFVSVQEEEGTGLERANQILERKLPKISEITAEKAEVIQPTTEGEIVAQEGDKAPLTTNEALKDVESTAKALEGKDINKVMPSEVYNEINSIDKEASNSILARQQELLKEGVRDFESDAKWSELNNILQKTKKFIAGDAKTISEAYHSAKADGSNPQLVEAVESLLTQPKIETDAIQVEEAEGVPTRQGAEAGQEVGQEVRREGKEVPQEKTLAAVAEQEGVVASFNISDLTGKDKTNKLNEARKRLRDFFERNWKDLNLTDAQLKKATTQAMTVTGEKMAQNLIDRVLKDSTKGIQRAEIETKREAIRETFEKHFSKAKPYKDAVKAYQDWKKQKDIAGMMKNMPNRVKKMIEDKALNAIKDPLKLDETLKFFEKVLSNESYAQQINKTAEKVEKYNSKPYKGVLKPFIDALSRAMPKAKYLFGRDELNIMLGKVDVTNEAVTDKMLAELDTAMDALMQKNPDYLPIMEFMSNYRDRIVEAGWHNISGVKLTDTSVGHFNTRVDNAQTLLKVVKEQMESNQVNYEDVKNLIAQVNALDKWLEKNRGRVSEKDGKFKGVDALQDIIDFLNTDYNGLVEAVKKTYVEALDQYKLETIKSVTGALPIEGGAKGKQINKLRENITRMLLDKVDRKAVQEALEMVPPKESREKRMKEAIAKNEKIAKAAREALNVDKLQKMEYALQTYKNHGIWVGKDIQAGVNEFSKAIVEAGLKIELTEPIRQIGKTDKDVTGLSGWVQSIWNRDYHKRVVYNMIDSDVAFRQLYATLIDNKLGFDGFWNSPYWNNLGYNLDNAITISQDETTLDTGAVVKAFQTMLGMGGSKAKQFYREAVKWTGVEWLPHQIKISKLGQVMASLSHYNRVHVEPKALKDTVVKTKEGYEVKDKLTNEVVRIFESKTEADNYAQNNQLYYYENENNEIVERESGEAYFKTEKEANEWFQNNKERVLDEFDTYQYGKEKGWKDKAHLTPSSMHNNFYKRADEKAHQEILKKTGKDRVVVKNLEEAKAILEKGEYDALVEVMNLMDKYEEKARIVAENMGMDFDAMAFYYSFRNTSFESKKGSIEERMIQMMNNFDPESGTLKDPGFVHERKNRLQGYLDYNALKNVLGYVREVNTSYHILPVLNAEMEAMRDLKKGYRSQEDKESLKDDGTQAISYRDMARFVDNMQKDRVRRYKAEFSNGRFITNKGLDFYAFYLDLDGVARRMMNVAKSRAMVDLNRPLLDGLPQIVRMAVEGVGLTQFKYGRVREISKIFDYMPEGSLTHNVGKALITRYDYEASSRASMPLAQWATDYYLSLADRMTKQTGWVAMFDKQMEALFGEKLDGKKFNEDENYRNTLLNDPLFHQAIKASDKYISSVHFARTTAAGRGAVAGGMLKAGTMGYRIYTPLMSYQMQALQQAHIGMMNAIMGSEATIGREASRVLGVIANNVTYAYLSKMNRMLWAFIAASNKGRKDEKEKLDEEFKALFTWEGAMANLIGSQAQIMMSGVGAIGPTLGNLIMAASEAERIKREPDPVKKRQISENMKWWKNISGTGFFPTSAMVDGKIPTKTALDAIIPLLGSLALEIGEGVGAHYDIEQREEEGKILPKGEDPDVFVKQNALGVLMMMMTGGFPLAKNVRSQLNQEERMARDKPYSLDMMKFMAFVRTDELINQGVDYYTKDESFRRNEDGELIYVIPSTKEVLTAAQIKEKMDEDGNLPEEYRGYEKNMKDVYIADGYLDNELTLDWIYEDMKEPKGYRSFQKGMWMNKKFVDKMVDVYEGARESRLLNQEEKFAVYEKLDEESKKLAQAIWEGKRYLPKEVYHEWATQLRNKLPDDIRVKISQKQFDAWRKVKQMKSN